MNNPVLSGCLNNSQLLGESNEAFFDSCRRGYQIVEKCVTFWAKKSNTQERCKEKLIEFFSHDFCVIFFFFHSTGHLASIQHLCHWHCPTRPMFSQQFSPAKTTNIFVQVVENYSNCFFLI